MNKSKGDILVTEDSKDLRYYVILKMTAKGAKVAEIPKSQYTGELPRSWSVPYGSPSLQVKFNPDRGTFSSVKTGELTFVSIEAGSGGNEEKGEGYEDLSTQDLRMELKARGLDSTGARKKLIERLEDDDEEEEEEDGTIYTLTLQNLRKLRTATSGEFSNRKDMEEAVMLLNSVLWPYTAPEVVLSELYTAGMFDKHGRSDWRLLFDKK